MSKKIIGLGALFLGVLILGGIFLLQYRGTMNAASEVTIQPTDEPQGSSTVDPLADPQKLMIPRWFLTSIMVDGKVFELGDKQLSLQFEEGGQANGQGACNGFGTTYEVGPGNEMSFGAIMSTKMMCDPGMDLENAYFQALEKVTMFRTEDYKVFLTSEDGQTSLVFSMPPK